MATYDRFNILRLIISVNVFYHIISGIYKEKVKIFSNGDKKCQVSYITTSNLNFSYYSYFHQVLGLVLCGTVRF